jgi:hypothetical protein
MTGRVQRLSTGAIEMPSQGRDCGPRGRVPAATQWLAMVGRAVAAGSRAGFRRFLAGLHESRRRQAAIERARYRHLIFDQETGIYFGERAAGRQVSPAE